MLIKLLSNEIIIFVLSDKININFIFYRTLFSLKKYTISSNFIQVSGVVLFTTAVIFEISECSQKTARHPQRLLPDYLLSRRLSFKGHYRTQYSDSKEKQKRCINQVYLLLTSAWRSISLLHRFRETDRK